MSTISFKQTLFSQFARIGKALSNGNRLELLEFLAQTERSVEELAKLSGLSVANTSQHLQQLRLVGLVRSRKHGLRVYYSINGNDVVVLLDSLRKVAENHLADIEQLVNSFLTVKDNLEPIPREELLQRIRDDLVILLDVRPAKEYASGHVAGAINVTPNELEKYLPNLDVDKEIIAYCRGPHCILAFDAVEKLRTNGFNARRMEDGFPEWKVANLPVKTII